MGGATIGAVVAVAFVVGSAFWIGTQPLTRTGPAGPAAPSRGTLEVAAQAAVAWADAYMGPGWGVIGALGEVVPSSLVPGPLHSNAFFTNPTSGGCSFRTIAPPQETFQIPPPTGDGSDGAASYWLVELANSSQTILSVLSIGGQTAPIAVGGCSSNASSFPTPLGSAEEDSSAAASSAWGDGGAAFLAGHPASTVQFSLTAAFSFIGTGQPPQWEVRIVDCSNRSAGAPTPYFEVTLNADTGAEVSSGSGYGSCPLSWVGSGTR